MALPEVFPDADHSMLAYVNATTTWVLDHSEELDALNLYLFARHLLFYAPEVESVKLALSLMAILSNPSDEESRQAIRELAVSDEFTLFALFAVSNWDNKNEDIYRVLRTINFHYAKKEEVLQALAKEADAVLSSDSCLNYMRHKTEQGEKLRLASQLGIDCDESHPLRPINFLRYMSIYKQDRL